MAASPLEASTTHRWVSSRIVAASERAGHLGGCRAGEWRQATRAPDPVRRETRRRVRERLRSRKPWCHIATRPATCFTIVSLSLRAPFSANPCRLLVRAHTGGAQETHPELDTALLHQVGQALPDTQACPADKGLNGATRDPTQRGDSSPFGSVLMVPNGRPRTSAADLVSCPCGGTAPASPNVRPSAWLLRVRTSNTPSNAMSGSAKRP